MENGLDIWQEASQIPSNKLELVIASLSKERETIQNPERIAMINRIIGLANYLASRREKNMLTRTDYQQVMQELGIGRHSVRSYLLEIKKRVYS